MNQEKHKHSRKSRFLIGSVGCGLGLSIGYIWSPDFLAGLTVWPFWVWTFIAVGLSVFGIRKRSWKMSLGHVLGWSLLAFLLNSEVRGLVRTLRPPAQLASVGLRIVTMNCAGGNIEAARDALRDLPDVVLLQESPSAKDVRSLVEPMRQGEEVEYQLISGPDASILVYGTIRPVVLPRGASNFVCARAHLFRWIRDVFIVSLRLQPPILRFDYWNPECWSTYAASKARRRKELNEILAFVEAQEPGAFVIVGGDFNTPPDPSIQQRLRETYTDTFADSGRGYGATAVAGFPMVRIDQIWFRGPCWTWRAGSMPTEHSDHLMAYAWLEPVEPSLED